MTELDHNKTSTVFPVLYFPYWFIFFTSDILRKFNPNIKGMSKGQGKAQTGLNVAVSGAKAAWVLWSVVGLEWFPFIYFVLCFKHFVHSWKISYFSYRGIPEQVRLLIDTMKNDSVSLIYGSTSSGRSAQILYFSKSTDTTLWKHSTSKKPCIVE